MNKFFAKIANFLQGRYGNDQLNIFLLIIWFILAILSVFLKSIYIFILIAELLIIGIIIFRALSRNINKRAYANRKFLSIINSIKNFFTLQSKKAKDIKTHRYIKCTHCNAQLRVPNKKGKHTVKCPKCGEDFKTNIRL